MLSRVTIVYYFLAFWSNGRGYSDLSDDVEDPDELLAKLRVERSDYSIGGPLAKTNKPGSSGSGATPAPAPAPAPQPSPAAAKPAPQPSPAGNPVPAPSSNGKGNMDNNKQQAVSQVQTPAKGGTGSPGPGGSANGKGGACPMSVYPSLVLSEISLGTAQFPEYNHKFTDTCKIAECAKICQKSSCNYFMRSSTNGLSYFYFVRPDKLSQPNFIDSEFYDSFIPQCNSGSSDMGNPPASPNAQKQIEEFMVRAAALARSFKEFNASAGQNAKVLQLPADGPLAQAGLSAASGDGILDITNGNGSRCIECVARDLFKKFLQKFNKSYADQYEEENHLNFFKNAIKRIKELNTKKQNPLDAMFGQNKFMDLHFSDVLKKLTGALKELNPAEKFEFDIGTMISGVPQKFDWRDEGVVPAIRYQKDCGSCYAFSATDLAAIQWAIDHDEKESYLLAPQYVLDCIHDQAAFGCDGGRPYLVLSTNGNCTGDSNCAWPRESCYPYQNAAGASCRATELACSQSEKPLIQVRQAYNLDVSSGGGEQEKQRLSALLQGGPVVALVAVTDHWQYYTSGIMRASQCEGADVQPNHAVLIVGYDFTDSTAPYYIIRNTWDSDWGEKGYFRMEAGQNTCGLAKFLSFACTADCGEGRSAKNLLERARRRLQKKGIAQPSGSTPTPVATYPQQTQTPAAAYSVAPEAVYSAAPATGGGYSAGVPPVPTLAPSFGGSAPGNGNGWRQLG